MNQVSSWRGHDDSDAAKVEPLLLLRQFPSFSDVALDLAKLKYRVRLAARRCCGYVALTLGSN